MQVIKGNHVSAADAKALEHKKDWQGAAFIYEKLLKQSPVNFRFIQRLIILFRKLGNVKKETQYIDAAIHLQQKKYTLNNTLNKKAATLSRQLNKMLGHTDKSGKAIFVSDDVLKLELRKERLLKKEAKVASKKI